MRAIHPSNHPSATTPSLSNIPVPSGFSAIQYKHCISPISCVHKVPSPPPSPCGVWTIPYFPWMPRDWKPRQMLVHRWYSHNPRCCGMPLHDGQRMYNGMCALCGGYASVCCCIYVCFSWGHKSHTHTQHMLSRVVSPPRSLFPLLPCNTHHPPFAPPPPPIKPPPSPLTIGVTYTPASNSSLGSPC